MNNNDYDVAVEAIKSAVEKSRYRAAKAGNAELLSLYYGIGKYVSQNTRNGFWGKDALKTISSKLKSELVGIRGFSETNLKYMRLFFEEWYPYVNRQPVADDIDWSEFISIGFSHHMEILLKTKEHAERLFYIHECATRA